MFPFLGVRSDILPESATNLENTGKPKKLEMRPVFISPPRPSPRVGSDFLGWVYLTLAEAKIQLKVV
jgi:hypothetical protein